MDFIYWLIIYLLVITVIVFVLYMLLVHIVLFIKFISLRKQTSNKFNSEFCTSYNCNQQGWYSQYIKYCINGFVSLLRGHGERYYTCPFKYHQTTNSESNKESQKQPVNIFPYFLNNKLINRFHVANSSTAKEGESTKREGNQ